MACSWSAQVPSQLPNFGTCSCDRNVFRCGNAQACDEGWDILKGEQEGRAEFGNFGVRFGGSVVLCGRKKARLVCLRDSTVSRCSYNHFSQSRKGSDFADFYSFCFCIFVPYSNAAASCQSPPRPTRLHFTSASISDLVDSVPQSLSTLEHIVARYEIPAVPHDKTPYDTHGHGAAVRSFTSSRRLMWCWSEIPSLLILSDHILKFTRWRECTYFVHVSYHMLFHVHSPDLQEF